MRSDRPPTILLADDCPVNRRLFTKLLQRDGYHIIEAADGLEAIELAPSAVPHVIVIDVMMPGMDGLEATRALRANPLTARIPIIMVSARVQEQDISAGLAAGADEYVFKPIRPREFRLRVRSMVRLREVQLEIEQAHTKLQKRTRLLAQLHEFCEGVLTDATPQETYRRIVETAGELLQSTRVSLLLPDPSNEGLRFAYAIGMTDYDWQDQIVPLSSPISGRAFSNHNEIIVNNEPLTEATQGRYESPCFASIPLICAPLNSAKGLIGVLNVTDKKNDGQYHPEDAGILRQFAQTAAIALNDLLNRQKLDETRDSIIFSLATLSEYRHQETGNHIERVRALSVLLAQQLESDPSLGPQIDETFVMNLGRGAPLHDIGKVAIPDAILLKRGKLTEDEFRRMQDHTRIGEKTLSSVIANGHADAFVRMAREIARHHHERFDGSGYPDKLAGDAIPLAARIVCVADSYDAIRMEREYKPARSHEEAVTELLEGSGTQFDPRLIEAFCAAQDQFRAIHDQYEEKGHREPALAQASSWVAAPA